MTQDTPGVAQWAFQSLFNRQTPRTKYQQMKQHQDEVVQLQQDLDPEEDTFHGRQYRRRFRARDDSAVPVQKNVQWNGLRRSQSQHGTDGSHGDDYTLPQHFPGKFPKDELLTSSATRSNLKDASKNMSRNNMETKENPKTDFINWKDKTSLSHGRTPKIDPAEILAQLDDNNDDLDLLLQSVQSGDIHTRYQTLRQELASELTKSQKLYDAYYRDVQRHNHLKKKYESMARSMEKLQMQNKTLAQKLHDSESKVKEDDFTLGDMKQTLQNTGKLEITLRRKIKYLENKLEMERELHKKEKFALEEKLYLMDVKGEDTKDTRDDTIDLLIRETGL